MRCARLNLRRRVSNKRRERRQGQRGEGLRLETFQIVNRMDMSLSRSYVKDCEKERIHVGPARHYMRGNNVSYLLEGFK